MMFKRCAAFFLVILLCLSALPVFALEADTLRGFQDGAGYQYVTFGQYPTEKDGTVKPILWRVLKTEDGSAYLLSEYILFASPVHADYSLYNGWIHSDLYFYLNHEFYNDAFTMREQQALLRCWEDNGLVTLINGDELRDKSIGFTSDKARLCESTPWAKRERPDNKKAKLMIYSKGHKYSPWWSRTESTDVVHQQRRVMDEGKTGRLSVGNPDMGVRPAIYLNTALADTTGGSGTKDDPIRLVVTDETLLNAGITDVTGEPDEAEQPEDVPGQQEPVDETAEPVKAVTEAVENEPAQEAAPVRVTEEDEASFGASSTIETNIGLTLEMIESETDEGNAGSEVVPAEESTSPVSSKAAFSAAADPASIHPLFPTLTAEGFLPEGEEEFVYADEDAGLWLYASQTLRIQIDRKSGTNSKKQPLRWFEARVYTRDASERFHLYPFNEEKYTNPYTLESVDKIAEQHQLVFAINSDYFIYRVARDKEEKKKNPNNLIPIGIEVRNGELLFSSPKKSSSKVYPPLDYLVFYEDGSVRAFANTIDGESKARAKAGEELAAQWMADGATDCLSFGPVLVEDGVLSPRASMYGSTPNPRTAFGYVEPGYYICVMVESRTADSKGESCIWLGEKMAELGCTSAMNLDGGATSAMLFMGRQLNKSGNYGDITNRAQNELLGIGTSPAVVK